MAQLGRPRPLRVAQPHETHTTTIPLALRSPHATAGPSAGQQCSVRITDQAAESGACRARGSRDGLEVELDPLVHNGGGRSEFRLGRCRDGVSASCGVAPQVGRSRPTCPTPRPTQTIVANIRIWKRGQTDSENSADQLCKTERTPCGILPIRASLLEGIQG